LSHGCLWVVILPAKFISDDSTAGGAGKMALKPFLRTRKQI
jgi:hypothetical protein